MTYRPIVRGVAGGTLFAFGVTLAGDLVLFSEDPQHEGRAESFGVVATASSSAVISVQDTITGVEIEVRRLLSDPLEDT